MRPAGDSRRAQRRKAAPLASSRYYGDRTPVTLTITYRGGAQGWMEVRAATGTFFVACDASVIELCQQVIQGGHYVRENAPGKRRRKASHS